MISREPYVRKHVHRWVLRGEFRDGGCTPLLSARRCEDCPTVQVVESTDLCEYAPSVRSIADVPWREPSRAESAAMTDLVFRGVWKP